jgi:hypothetical protein
MYIVSKDLNVMGNIFYCVLYYLYKETSLMWKGLYSAPATKLPNKIYKLRHKYALVTN